MCNERCLILDEEINKICDMKHFKLLIFITVMMAFFNIKAYAVNWSLMFNGNGNKYYVDTDSIVRKGSDIDAWLMIDLSKTEFLQGRAYKSLIYLWSFDRENRTWTLLSSVYYAGNNGSGDVIISYEETFPTPKRIVPGSIADSIMKILFNNYP